jgi:hypothetical protein
MKRPFPVFAGSGYGFGLFVIDSPCGTVFGDEGGVPGFANWMLNSGDGSRQFGVMINAEDAPAGVSELVDTLAVDQGIREVFAGQPCAAAEPVAL